MQETRFSGSFFGTRREMFSRFMKVLSLFTLLPAVFVVSHATAQSKERKPVQLIHADDIYYDKSYIDAQRLIGNVQLLYQGTLFLCDSAYLYPNQNFDAFGNIRVNKGTEYSVTGDALFFDKASGQSRLQRNVMLRDREMTLTSEDMSYNLETDIAQYHTGGKIVSKRNNNVLTSRKGIYYVNSQTFHFRDDVVLKNPEYTVWCDTLQYNEKTEIAYFFGPTRIRSEETRIYCENGWYDSRSEVCQFNKNARVVSEKTALTGDSIYYNGKEQYGEAFRHISIRDTTSELVITGHYGHYNEKTKRSMVTQDAMLTQFFEEDSLFLTADTLLAIPDSSDRQLIRAFHHVQIFKSDMQGRSDSLAYSQVDSTIRMFFHPVLWSDESQITGDSISIRTWEGQIDRLLVRGNSFIVSQALPADTSQAQVMRFNQIKGRNTVGYFRENDLYKVRVEGNGQLVYFPTEEKKDAAPKIIGHNKGDCSDIEITVKNNEIEKITLLREPDSVFSPMKLAKEEEFILEGYQWLIEEKPLHPSLRGISMPPALP